MKALFTGLLAIGLSGPAALAASCGAPAVLETPLPQSPFGAIAGSEPCTLYVSMIDPRGGEIAAYRREGNQLVQLGAVPRTGFGAIALSHDGSLLVAPQANGAQFIDTKRLLAGDRSATLAELKDGGRDAAYVAITPDDRTLFISDEHSGGISVVDLVKARANGYGKDAVIGTIRVGNGPVGLAITPDGRTLFATVQIFPVPNAPVNCKSETGKSEALHREGALLAIDVERARSDPAHAVLGGRFAGCNPVRVALSPTGDRAYVTARASDALYVFDTSKVGGSGGETSVTKITVGSSPVGVAVSKDGRRIFVSNSNRFADTTVHQSISVIAADKIGSDNPIVGSYAVGGFPRELSVTPDGTTLIVANAGTKSLTLIDLATAPLAPAKP